MLSFEDVEQILEEWFTDYATTNGIKGITKLYAKIQCECERNLDFQLDVKINEALDIRMVNADE